jgi:hypothetical protein
MEEMKERYVIDRSKGLMGKLSQKESVNQDDFLDDEELVADEDRLRIAEGVYLAQCIKIEKMRYYRTLKLHLRFKVIDGEHFGMESNLFINMTDSKGRKFKKVPPASNYYKNWVIANYGNPPTRGDRMSPKVFLNGIFRVVVRDAVPRFPDGKAMPDSIHYSVISHLVRREG